MSETQIPQNLQSNETTDALAVDVFGSCRCCESLKATPNELLEHFTSHLPDQGTAQVLRFRWNTVSGNAVSPTDRAVIDAVTAAAISWRAGDEIHLAGLILNSCGNAH